MEKYLRPERLNIDPKSTSATKEYNHWKLTFLNFLSSLNGENINKFHALMNFISPDVYEYLDGIDNYDLAIAKLDDIFIKTKNDIFCTTLTCYATTTIR